MITFILIYSLIFFLNGCLPFGQGDEFRVGAIRGV